MNTEEIYATVLMMKKIMLQKEELDRLKRLNQKDNSLMTQKYNELIKLNNDNMITISQITQNMDKYKHIIKNNNSLPFNDLKKHVSGIKKHLNNNSSVNNLEDSAVQDKLESNISYSIYNYLFDNMVAENLTK